MDVQIIGGGCIGLTTALAFLEAGFKNVEIIAESFESTTSHGAGAIWRPFEITSKSHQLEEWCRVSLDWLKKMSLQHGAETIGIHLVKGVELGMTKMEPLPFWTEMVDECRYLSQEELSKEGHGYLHGITYYTWVVHPEIFLKWLSNEIRRLGGKFSTRTVAELSDLSGDIVVNCAGNYGGKLANDKSTYPIRGQTVKVFQPDIEKFIFVLDGPLAISYIIPRLNGEVVVGGTSEAHSWDTKSNANSVNNILTNAFKLCPKLKSSSVLTTWAGLRPGRSNGPRVELICQSSSNAEKQHIIVHNYGHGGSGHTIHWGCAKTAVSLVKQFLGHHSKI